MCGIAGYFLKEADKHPVEDIETLLNPIRPRGPDDEGVCLISRKKETYRAYQTEKTSSESISQFLSINNTDSFIPHDLALIHTRYSIIDLSAGGHQPFISQDKSVIAVFNGEIYNYLELRKELLLLGAQFKTSSDTEVLVEGYRIFKNKIWSRLNGFWAVALYDFKNKTITLARDRIGVAPLYYRMVSSGLYFSSTIQSLVDISPKDITLNEDVMRGFIQCGIKDHDDTTYYSEIKSVPSKTAVVFELNQYDLSKAKHNKYWDFPQKRLTTDDISLDEAVKKFRDIFFNAVDIRLRADVKLAFELSGGLDSSSIVAAASILRKNNITTYTAKVKDVDEEPYARSILEKYPVDYRVLEHIEGDFINNYQQFSKLMEEPYDNPNAYTHHEMLNIMKKEGVSVVVTGAGGDEVLSGYEGSFWSKAYVQMKQEGMDAYLHADWYEFCRRFKTWKMTEHTVKHYFFDSLKRIKRPFSKKIKAEKNPAYSSALNHYKRYQTMTYHQRALYHFNVALVPFYMRSSDHFTMSIPVEHRFPLLDYRIVDFGMQMPPQYLFHAGWTKYLLRKVMEPYLPKKILWRRKKMGFTFPYAIFFSKHRSAFEPIFNQFLDVQTVNEHFSSYDELLKTQPILLWRIISTGIWIKDNLK